MVHIENVSKLSYGEFNLTYDNGLSVKKVNENLYYIPNLNPEYITKL